MRTTTMAAAATTSITLTRAAPPAEVTIALPPKPTESRKTRVRQRDGTNAVVSAGRIRVATEEVPMKARAAVYTFSSSGDARRLPPLRYSSTTSAPPRTRGKRRSASRGKDRKRGTDGLSGREWTGGW